jgi:hypothetical protein
LGFETQMRRALAGSYPVRRADLIEVLVEDIDAAMFAYVCGRVTN